ncbi:MAG: tetratricopeptide repeat protein, partial [Vicinamibacterales bacterium]
FAQGAPARAAQPAAPAPQKTALAYEQFLLARYLEDADDVAGAIAAYRRAMELAPTAADIPAELAALYLREDRVQEATSTAELALKIAPTNREANRVLGIVYAARSESDRQGAPPPPAGARPDENTAKAIGYLELAVASPIDADPNARAALARLYVRAASFDKAIPLLTDLVNHQPGWIEGPLLLAESYVGAGRVKDGTDWLENRVAEDPRLLPTLADFYERQRRWVDAARAYGLAVQLAPRNAELRTRYASALLNSGDREAMTQARDVLRDITSTRATDARALYLLSQAERRLGEYQAAEATARRLIAAQNGRSVFGYYALAEALEGRRQYKAVADALAPAVDDLRRQPGDHAADLGLLLPHLGFAYQQIGQHDKAVAAFDELHRLQPNDQGITAYLIEANLAAKRYGAAVEAARQARIGNPNDLRLARLHAEALRQDGKVDQGIAVLEDAVKAHADEPPAYMALAQLYSDASRGPQAVKVLQDAQTRFPANNAIVFELGAVFDKQKKFADAEAAFQTVIRREPDHAPALNYLGYMLAERGERLDESVAYVKRALQVDPDNGSYLDSLGWAYFKASKFDLAEENLRRAADQLMTNSVVQDHYGDVLAKLGRNEDAVAAWARALDGDGDSIDRAGIDKKIRAARQKIGKR